MARGLSSGLEISFGRWGIQPEGRRESPAKSRALAPGEPTKPTKPRRKKGRVGNAHRREAHVGGRCPPTLTELRENPGPPLKGAHKTYETRFCRFCRDRGRGDAHSFAAEGCLKRTARGRACRHPPP